MNKKPMKLVILGANGRTGKHVLQIALERGMQVTAVIRSADRLPNKAHDRLNIMVGDPCDPAFLKEAFEGQDAIISALGGRRPSKAATSVYFRSADAIVKAAAETGLNRVLVTSTALLFDDQKLLGKILQALVPNIVRSTARMEQILRTSGLSWTSARCGFLNDKNEARYEIQKNNQPKNGTTISRRALANFLLDAIDDPKTHRAAFGVSSAA